MLKHENFRDWNLLLGKAFCASDPKEAFETAVEAIRALTDCESCYFIFFRKDQTPVIAHPQSLPLDGQLYTDGPYLIDPFYLAWTDKGKTGTFLLRDIAPGHLPSSKRYRDYLSSMYGPVDELATTIALPDQAAAHISLSRRIEVGRYSKKDLALLEAAAPLLGSLMAQLWEQLQVSVDPGQQQMSRHLEFYASFGRDVLTEREYDVAHLLLKGYNAAEIGPILSISTGTARNHMKQIYGKFEVSSQAELAGLFIEQLMAEIDGVGV